MAKIVTIINDRNSSISQKSINQICNKMMVLSVVFGITLDSDSRQNLSHCVIDAIAIIKTYMHLYKPLPRQEKTVSSKKVLSSKKGDAIDRLANNLQKIIMAISTCSQRDVVNRLVVDINSILTLLRIANDKKISPAKV